MNQNQRFSILTFPQFYDGTELGLNIVVLPRNQNPLANAIDGEPTIPPMRRRSPMRKLSFRRPHLRRPDRLSGHHGAAGPGAADHAPPALHARSSRRWRSSSGSSTSRNDQHERQREPGRRARRAAAGARTDRSRSTCRETLSEVVQFRRRRARRTRSPTKLPLRRARRQAGPGVQAVDGRRSAGARYSRTRCASRFSQPRSASSTDRVDRRTATHFPNGGWLYVDLAAGSDYRQQPMPTPRSSGDTPRGFRVLAAKPRHVFASILFPVSADADRLPANYDQLFIAAAEYDDGFAKIVHCRQPTNRDLLEEKSDGFHPDQGRRHQPWMGRRGDSRSGTSASWRRIRRRRQGNASTRRSACSAT